MLPTISMVAQFIFSMCWPIGLKPISCVYTIHFMTKHSINRRSHRSPLVGSFLSIIHLSIWNDVFGFFDTNTESGTTEIFNFSMQLSGIFLDEQCGRFRFLPISSFQHNHFSEIKNQQFLWHIYAAVTTSSFLAPLINIVGSIIPPEFQSIPDRQWCTNIQQPY